MYGRTLQKQVFESQELVNRCVGLFGTLSLEVLRQLTIHPESQPPPEGSLKNQQNGACNSERGLVFSSVLAIKRSG